MIRQIRAFPALFRNGIAQTLAYRAEFIVWMLTITMPLVMLALWSTVAAEGPFGRFGRDDFVAYYLGAFIVRTLTGSWIVWEINQEIRTGTLSMRLLRPIHPFVAYAAEHLAAIPLRAAMALPMATILLVSTGGGRVVRDPVQLALLPLAILGAWGITFLAGALIGTLGLYLEQSMAIFQLWLGLFAVLSGYLVPLELLPRWVGGVAHWLPFRYMLGFPVELMVGMTSRAEALAGVATTWTYVTALGIGASLVWRAGVRRFEAYGA